VAEEASGRRWEPPIAARYLPIPPGKAFTDEKPLYGQADVVASQFALDAQHADVESHIL
jgi:hypothetical protein